MKILYFSFVELDVPNACQTHTLGILNGFSKNACEVSAIVPQAKKVRPIIPGVHFYYLWPWRFSVVGKFWVKLLCGFYLGGLCLFNNYDAIYIRELETNPFPRWCSILFRIPLYIEVNSILIENLRKAGADKRLLSRVKRFQEADFRHAKGLFLPSYPRFRWAIDFYGLAENKVHLILNGTEVHPLVEMVERAKVLRKLNLPPDGFYLGFLGSVWDYYDLTGILKAIQRCQEEIKDLALIIIGGGPAIDALKNKSVHMNLQSKVIDLGYIQPGNLSELISAFDVGLMNLTCEGIEDLGPVTTRFATYAVFQIPVIANDRYIKHYPEDLVAGLSLVPVEDDSALAELIVRLYKHLDERKEKTRVLYNYVSKKLTWEVVAADILDIMKKDSNQSREVRSLEKP